MYLALVLDETSRKKLEKVFPPKYPDFIGHHITLKFGVLPQTPVPDRTPVVKVVGYADDGSLEALVVSVDGNTTRLDGSTYHITWSLNRSKGRKPNQSNDLLSNGFEKVDTPIEVKTSPELLN